MSDFFYNSLIDGQLDTLSELRLIHERTDKWLKLSNGVSVTPGHMFLTTDGTYEPISDILEKRKDEVVLVDGSVEQLSAELIEFSAENTEHYPTGSMWVAENDGAVALTTIVQPADQLALRTQVFIDRLWN